MRNGGALAGDGRWGHGSGIADVLVAPWKGATGRYVGLDAAACEAVRVHRARRRDPDPAGGLEGRRASDSARNLASRRK